MQSGGGRVLEEETDAFGECLSLYDLCVDVLILGLEGVRVPELGLGLRVTKGGDGRSTDLDEKEDELYSPEAMRSKRRPELSTVVVGTLLEDHFLQVRVKVRIRVG